MDEIQRKLKDVHSKIYKFADQHCCLDPEAWSIAKSLGHKLGNIWFLISEERRASNSHECPCVITTNPCHPNCTCVNLVSSSGCHCCARYGSEAQRKDAADAIVKAMISLRKDYSTNYFSVGTPQTIQPIDSNET